MAKKRHNPNSKEAHTTICAVWASEGRAAVTIWALCVDRKRKD